MMWLFKIFNFVKPILDKQIPMFSQTVSEFSKTKSNRVGMVLVMFGISVLTSDLTNVLGHVYTIFGVVVICIRDAVAKIK